MIVIIDGTALCFKTYFGMKEILCTSEGARTEIIYGFLKQLIALKRNFMLDRTIIVFAWDAKDNKADRRKLYPEYKYKRKTGNIDKEVYEQMDLLRTDILPSMGFNNHFIQSKREADDVIASLVFDYENEENIVIVANDKDLYQLLNDGVSIYNIGRKESNFYTYEDYQKEWGIENTDWVTVKAIGGCVSDNVEGVKGVGEKTVCKWIKGELKKESVAYKKIDSQEGIDIEQRNLPLVQLPFGSTEKFIILNNSLSSSNFEKVFEKYEFESFLEPDNFKGWEYLFILE